MVEEEVVEEKEEEEEGGGVQALQAEHQLGLRKKSHCHCH